MNSVVVFMFGFNKDELKILKKLNSPVKIQDFLESIPFNFEKHGITLMSPRKVLREKKAHCIEGALFAAAALWVNSKRPLLMDLRALEHDFDHVVALFKIDGHWGAISKTNHVVLRYREPIYKSPRELAVSYFHEYFLDDGKKTMRDFSKPFDLRKYQKQNWTTAEEDLWFIERALNKSSHEQILTRSMLARLRSADKIEIAAGKLTQWKK
ncbi:MAG: hypothetical protein AAB795_01975 [Patescibacteria group bacterium]